MQTKKIKTKKLTFLSLLVGYSLILYIIETYIPNPLIAIFPGAKLGLSNIVTLIALLTLGFKETLIVLSVRILMSSIFAGPISYLLFSISGGYLSLVAMYFFSKFEFSTISVSIIGAISHNIGQVLMASIIILNMNMFSYLPFILFTSIITGVFVGFSVKFTLNKFNTTFFINY